MLRESLAPSVFFSDPQKTREPIPLSFDSFIDFIITKFLEMSTTSPVIFVTNDKIYGVQIPLNAVKSD